MIESNHIRTRLTRTSGERGFYEHEFFVENESLVCDLIYNGIRARQMFCIPLKTLFAFDDRIIDFLNEASLPDGGKC